MDDRLHNLEVQIGDQMTVIKTMLLSLEERVGDVDNSVKRVARGTSKIHEILQPLLGLLNDYA
jgi:hypothetical protein